MSRASPDPSITVAVVAICGPAHLRRCLDALALQEQAPRFDLLVVYDPHLDGIEGVQAEYPTVRMIANEGQRSPLELAARAVREATGDLIVLTEDHCVPAPDWVRRLCDAQAPGRAAVGGSVEALEGASPVDWAFYYVDFFRYMKPVRQGPSPSLTVCNVAYRRELLQAVSPLWQRIFHETAINDALRQRFGSLWLEPAAEVRMRRNVRFADAVYERYAFGRLFGCTRLDFGSTADRLYYALLAPALPLLLLARMARRALPHPQARKRFLRALGPLAAMVLAWSWGEWLGYLTRRRPTNLVVAPEIRARQRAALLASTERHGAA
ncbi:MAG: glycosyltransferase [Longimicrobiales bacterium]